MVIGLTAALGKNYDLLTSFLRALLARKNTDNKLLIDLCENRRGCPGERKIRLSPKLALHFTDTKKYKRSNTTADSMWESAGLPFLEENLNFC